MTTRNIGLLVCVTTLPLIGLAFLFLFQFQNFALFTIFSALGAASPSMILIVCRPRCTNCRVPLVGWREAFANYEGDDICSDCKETVSSDG
jgi:hypothetical protein